MAAHSQRAHAKLAPSASSRWMNCPGSIRLSEGIEDKETVFAAEGTAAHELAQHCLEHNYDTEHFRGYVIDTKAKNPNLRFLPAGMKADGVTKFEVNDEMVDGVQMYVDYCRGKCADGDEVDIEYRFDLTHVAPDMFGTGDLVVYKPSEKHLLVIDLKYGRGVPVEPKENSQALTYAVGALKRHHNREVNKVTISIVQPRCPHPDGPIREWETDKTTVMEFQADLAKAAEATTAPDAPLKAGKWCKFCPAAATCPALQEFSLAAAQSEFTVIEDPVAGHVTNMDSAELGEALEQVGVVEDWCRRVREFAHHEATNGRTPAGFKLVAGRSSRFWKEPEEVKMLLGMGFGWTEDEYLSEPELKSPAQMEKLLKGAQKKQLAPLIRKSSGATVLAPADDKRPAVRADAGDEFAVVET